MHDAEVIFLTVTYRNPEETVRFVRSLRVLVGWDRAHIVVVDSESTPGSRVALEALEAEGSGDMTCLFSARNTFYWGGAALGLEAIRRRRSTLPAWTVVCNNDMSVEQPDFLARLLAQPTGNIGILAPSILSAGTGKDANPGVEHPYTHIHLLYWKIFYLHYVIARILYARKRLTRLLPRRPQVPSERNIYAPQGACVIFSKEFFSLGGILDTNFDIFNEELAAAEAARSLGLRVRYCPQLRIQHREHASTGRTLSRWYFEKSRSSYRYIERAYFSSADRRREMLRDLAARCASAVGIGA